MTLKDYRSHFVQNLTPLYDAVEAERFFYITLEELKGWRRVDFALNNGYVFAEGELQKWDEVLTQLQQQKPIQYIFGHTWFYGLQFKVNPYTLIPRPETEELVDWIIAENPAGATLLDIGTGSGCIAISLAKNIESSAVSAIDISAGALETAGLNAKANNVSVNFIQQDVLLLDRLPELYGVIVSNPPYVRHLEKEEIKPNVLEFEPHTALFVDDTDPLIFYRKIALLAKDALKPGGKLYFEINQYLGPETVALLQDLGYTVELRKDMFGNDRMIRAML